MKGYVNAGEQLIVEFYVHNLRLDFGHCPRNQIAGTWQPDEGLMAGP